MIAADAVDRSPGRIDRQPSSQGVLLDALVKLQSRRERPPLRAIFDQFEGEEQPSTSNVADVGMGHEAFAQALFQ